MILGDKTGRYSLNINGPTVLTQNLGCFNDTTVGQQQALLPAYIASLHDHVTLEGCAAACDTHGGGAGGSVVAGIRDGNHCYCGAKAALSAPTARALNRPLTECLVPAAACPCVSSDLSSVVIF